MNAELASNNVVSRFQSFLVESGAAQAVGGVEILDQGLAELQKGLALVAIEIMKADDLHVGLADAVIDHRRFPHLASLHGFLGDLLKMEVPQELLPWATSLIQMGPPPDAPVIRHGLTYLALHPSNAVVGALARLALFEAVVLNQRLLLMASGTSLEVVPGQEGTVEALAQHEVEHALSHEEYGDDLLDLEDPLPVLVAGAFECLVAHVHEINEELRWATSDIWEQIETRKRLMAVLEQLPAADAVLLYNEGGFEGEVLGTEDLKARHPGLLGELSRDALYQRRRRAKMKARDIVVRSLEIKKNPSFADLLLSEIEGEES